MRPPGTEGESPAPPALVIVSTGRSGSTLLHELLAYHEAVVWLSPVSDRAPEEPARQRRLVAAAGMPVIGPLVRRRWPPDEAWGVWNHHHAGFVRPFRDLRASDVTATVRASLRRYFAGLVSPARPSVLLKITGWPRAGFLADVLPGVRFVHLVRDGREVARSLMDMPWWLGWHGPENWRFGPLSDEEEEAWARSEHSFAWLAGLQWRRVLAAAGRSAARIGAERWLDVRYEDLCADPVDAIGRMLAFGGLPVSPAIEGAVANGTVRPSTRRWDAELSVRDGRILAESLRSTLEDWGYE